MVDIFLHLDGIDGESTDRGHEDWIEIHSVSWGAEAVSASAPRGGVTLTGIARQLPLVLSAPTSIASPRLFAAVTQTTRLERAMIDVRRLGAERSQSIVRWNLSDLTVSRFEIDATADGVTNSFVLLAQRVELTALRWTDAGSPEMVSQQWDFTPRGVRVTPPN